MSKLRNGFTLLPHLCQQPTHPHKHTAYFQAQIEHSHVFKIKMIHTIQSKASKPTPLGHIGFQSFIKSFGISIENIIHPIENAEKHTPKKEQPKLDSSYQVTLDNVRELVHPATTFGTQQQCFDLPKDRTILQSSLKSMLKTELVSMEQEIQNLDSRNRNVCWLSRIYKRARLPSEVYHLAVCIMDMFFSMRTVEEEVCEKVAITSLWMASKFQRTLKYSVASFIQLCDKPFASHQVVLLQENILTELNFNLSISTGLNFLKMFTGLVRVQQRTYALANYLLELSMLESRYLNFKKSQIALSALYLASLVFETQTSLLFEKVPISNDRTKMIAQMLLWTLNHSNEPQCMQTNKKFSTSHFFEIARIEFRAVPTTKNPSPVEIL